MSALISLPRPVPAKLILTEDGEWLALCTGPCGTYVDQLNISPMCQPCQHKGNMLHVAHAEHHAYHECIQFEGDSCSECEEFVEAITLYPNS